MGAKTAINVENVEIRNNKIYLYFINDYNCRACEHNYRIDICKFTDKVVYQPEGEIEYLRK